MRNRVIKNILIWLCVIVSLAMLIFGICALVSISRDREKVRLVLNQLVDVKSHDDIETMNVKIKELYNFFNKSYIESNEHDLYGFYSLEKTHSYNELLETAINKLSDKEFIEIFKKGNNRDVQVGRFDQNFDESLIVRYKQIFQKNHWFYTTKNEFIKKTSIYKFAPIGGNINPLYINYKAFKSTKNLWTLLTSFAAFTTVITSILATLNTVQITKWYKRVNGDKWSKHTTLKALN
ncbi:hypothetical protein [Mycoplasmopsis californica]|nr:hypothetical protein [Mycoplasmopsis californica]